MTSVLARRQGLPWPTPTTRFSSARPVPGRLPPSSGSASSRACRASPSAMASWSRQTAASGDRSPPRAAGRRLHTGTPRPLRPHAGGAERPGANAAGHARPGVHAVRNPDALVARARAHRGPLGRWTLTRGCRAKAGPHARHAWPRRHRRACAGGAEHETPAGRKRQLGIGLRLGCQLDALGHHDLPTPSQRPALVPLSPRASPARPPAGVCGAACPAGRSRPSRRPVRRA